jgi:hypothetical protein
MSPTSRADGIARLGFLATELVGTELVAPSPWTAAGPATATVSGEVGLADTAVIQRYEQRRDGAVSFSALNVFLVDVETGDTLLYAFDAVGFAPDPPARGNWDGDRLILERATERGFSRTTYELTFDGYRYVKEFRLPEQQLWEMVVSGTFTPPA